MEDSPPEASQNVKNDIKDVSTGVASFQKLVEPLSPDGSTQGRGWMRFRSSVRNIILMCRMCRYFTSGSNFRYCMQFDFLDTLTHQPPGAKSRNLAFDPNYFRVKEDRIPLRLVEIMSNPPEVRSVEEVYLLHNMLGGLEIFKRYSLTLQLLLARVVRYQRLERRRVVIKNGHIGQSFYFVFTGLLAVTKDMDGNSAFVDKEPILIRRGMSFGDVALIKGLKRNSTVVCMEESELMVVDKEDFFANKMDVELKREFDYRFSYFRSIQLVSSWSSSNIEKIADRSQVEQIRYGRVMVKDTNEMGNIIFIGKGQCDVLRVVDLTTCSTYQRVLKKHLESAQEKEAVCNRRPGEESDKQEAQKGSVSKYKVLKNLPARSRVMPTELPTVACFQIDSLYQGSMFGLNQYLMAQRQRDRRRFTLISRSVEILRVEKTRFDELVDDVTMKKLEALQKTYPSDEELCTVFLEHCHWKDFKNGVVQDLLYHREESKTPKPKQPGSGGPGSIQIPQQRCTASGHLPSK